MKIISENLHIISKNIKEAVINRNEDFISDFIKKQAQTNPDYIDLNIGPGKKALAGAMKWLSEIAVNITDIPLSFDSTNSDEIKEGLKIVKNPSKCIINSTSADADRAEMLTSLAKEYDTNLISLTMNRETGIPKTADERLELAFSVYETASEKEISNEKLIFDPLILPVCVEQNQGLQALESLRMFKESFDPPVKTVIGLSNISNGSPSELRPLINKVFAALAFGCGLDYVIADSFDRELIRINKVLEAQIPEQEYDKIYIDLCQMMINFDDLENVEYDKSSEIQTKIFKTAEILLNKKIYSHSYTEI